MAPTRKTKKILFWLGLSLPMFALMVMVWLVHREDGRSSNSLNWVIQNSKIMDLFSQAQEHIVDAEANQRGYLLTGRADYLQPYQDAMTSVNEDIDGLKKLTKSNPEQSVNVIALAQLVRQELVFNPATAFADGRTAADASVVALTEHGRKEIEDMRHILYVAHEEQERALGRHQEAVADEAISSQLTFLALILAVAVALIFVVVILVRLEKLQQFVTVCAWTGRVKSQGQWLRLDEYLKTEFDISVSHSLSQEAAEKMRVEIEELNRAENRPAAVK